MLHAGSIGTARAGSSVAWRAGLIRQGDERAWNELYQTHPLSRAIVPKWEELAGWSNHRLGLFEGHTLIGGLILSVRRVPMLPVSLSRVTLAMVGPTGHGEMLHALLAAIERFCIRRFVIETEFRLRIPACDDIEGYKYYRELMRVLTGCGYRPLNKVDSTYLVRIDKDDDALLTAFEPSARNKIRRAQKAGVQISTSNDMVLLEQFYNAYRAMSERKQAPIEARTLVVDGLKPLIEAGHARLFAETYDGQVSNMAIVDVLGLPCYVLGVRTEANVRDEVPGAAQALHYEIMRVLRNEGKKYYDLGGCEGPTPIAGHPNYGVWRFKYGFQGSYVRLLPYFRKTRGPLSRPVLDFVHRLRGDYI